MARIHVEREEKLKKGTIAQEILRVLSEHPVSLASYKGANINATFLPSLEQRGIGRRRRNNVRIALDRLRRQKFIDQSFSDDRFHLRLTLAGMRRLKQYQFENLELAPPRSWDNVWRVVMFDIPEEKKRARDALSKKLKAMRFYKLQKSVFVHYMPCEDEIIFIEDLFDIEQQITCLEATSLGNQEAEVRRHFKLKN